MRLNLPYRLAESNQFFWAVSTEGIQVVYKVDSFNKICFSLAIVSDNNINVIGKPYEQFLIVAKMYRRKFTDYHSILSGMTTERNVASSGTRIRQGFKGPFSSSFTFSPWLTTPSTSNR